MTKIYVIAVTVGEYSDATWDVVAAFSSRAEAEEDALKAQKFFNDTGEMIGKIKTTDVDEYRKQYSAICAARQYPPYFLSEPYYSHHEYTVHETELKS